MKVTLTWGELHLAAQIGTLRHMEALNKHLPDKHGADSMNGWTIHIEGAAGEIAAAKALGIYWGGTVNTFKSLGDIGARLEVRTRSRDYYELLVRDNDPDNSIFILVTGVSPNYTVVGWLEGFEAKKNDWRRDYGNRPPAFFVPHNELKSIESLKEKMK